MLDSRQFSVTPASSTFPAPVGPSLLALDGDSFMGIIPVPLLADTHLDCQEQVLNASFQCCQELLSLVCLVCSLDQAPRLLQLPQPHSWPCCSLPAALHSSVGPQGISSPLYLWKNLRLFITDNVLQQLPGHPFFLDGFIGRNRVGFPKSFCPNSVASQNSGGRVRLLAHPLFRSVGILAKQLFQLTCLVRGI